MSPYKNAVKLTRLQQKQLGSNFEHICDDFENSADGVEHIHLKPLNSDQGAKHMESVEPDNDKVLSFNDPETDDFRSFPWLRRSKMRTVGIPP